MDASIFLADLAEKIWHGSVGGEALTEREIDVLEGEPPKADRNRDIGKQLNIAEETVKVQWSNASWKNSLELVIGPRPSLLEFVAASAITL